MTIFCLTLVCVSIMSRHCRESKNMALEHFWWPLSSLYQDTEAGVLLSTWHVKITLSPSFTMPLSGSIMVLVIDGGNLTESVKFSLRVFSSAGWLAWHSIILPSSALFTGRERGLRLFQGVQNFPYFSKNFFYWFYYSWSVFHQLSILVLGQGPHWRIHRLNPAFHLLSLQVLSSPSFSHSHLHGLLKIF